MSSMTAAPRIALLGLVVSAPSSIKTAEDADARSDERGGEEDGRIDVLPESEAGSQATGEREDHAEDADERSGTADLANIGDLRLEADPEEEEGRRRRAPQRPRAWRQAARCR